RGTMPAALPALTPVIPPLPCVAHPMPFVGAGWRGWARGEQMAYSPRRLALPSVTPEEGDATGREGARRCQC
ncbi:MAG: hypothetical protein KDE56_16675, partial [Anaerolineales bacterium]|nr:hypothetical protein [Anaerolineales bacterium]